MKRKCAFCDLKKQSHFRIGENKHAIAMLDIYPITKGHALVISKRHVERMEDLTDEEIVSLVRLYTEVAKKIMRATNHKGFWLRYNYHPYLKESKLVLRHVHWHIVPRSYNDDFFKKITTSEGVERGAPSARELEAFAKKVGR